MESGPAFAPIAIVGYGCVFPPDSYDVAGYWQNLLSGTSGIGEPDPDRWDWSLYHDPDRSSVDRTYCRLGGFIREYTFPSDRFGFDPATIAALTRTQQLVLDSACQALAMSGVGSGLGGHRSGLFVGNMLGDEALLCQSLRARAVEIAEHLRQLPEVAALDHATREGLLSQFLEAMDDRTKDADVRAEGLLPSGIAPTVGRLLGVNGPAVLADGACASGLMIIDVATRFLADRSLDVAVASGVMANMAVTGNVCFAKIGGLSPTGSHPLDADADGLVPGEGVGTVVLKRLDDALSDGDGVHGVIRGIATRCDGKGKAIYAPSTRGQASAMRRALEVAGISPDQIDHLETHATSTPTGDVVELESIAAVYGGTTRATPLSIGSGKALIGHTFPAAGMANLIKVLLAFERQTLPPVHGIGRPQPILSEAPFAVHQTAASWPERDGTRRAVANAFGFGGVNTSICLEDRPSPLERASATPVDAPQPSRLAVLGIGAVLPGVATFADLDPEAAFPTSTAPSRADGVDGPAAGQRRTRIDDWEFPWRRFRVPPATLVDIDRAQQLALVAADEALRHASSEPESWREAGVFIGASAGLETSFTRNLRIRAVEFGAAFDSLDTRGVDVTTRRAVTEEITRRTQTAVAATNENALPGYMDSIIGGRIGNMLDLRGTNMVIDDGANSFGTALEVAARHLAQRDCPVALVGGVHANLLPDYVEPFSRMLADRGDDVSSMCPGEGAVMLLVCAADSVPAGMTPVATLELLRTAEAGVAATPEPFFFGAQGAVDVVRSIARLDAPHPTAPASEDGPEDPPPNRVITVRCGGALTRHPDPVEPEGGDRRSDRTGDLAGYEALAASGDAAQSGAGIWFRSASTLVELLETVESALRSGSGACEAPTGGQDASDVFRIALTYRSPEELNKKLALTASQLL